MDALCPNPCFSACHMFTIRGREFTQKY